MRFPWQRKDTGGENLSIDTVMRRIEATLLSVSGIAVTPENCMRSPTVHAIVTAVSRRLSVSPVRIMAKTIREGREYKELLPNHPVAKLLKAPNPWTTPTNFWTDATSVMLRYGRYQAWIGRGVTGPIRRLVPMDPAQTEFMGSYSPNMDPRIATTWPDGTHKVYDWREVLYARGGARDFIKGDSPVEDVRESIAIEIAAEEFGAAFFGNGALPLLYFVLQPEFRGFRSQEEEDQFINAFQESFSGRKRFRAMMLPKGIDLKDIKVENEKAQFIETRKLVRTIIAGAFGVPPHLVGDLERATFNNVEQQDTDFVINVVMPIARVFEESMERDLLTDEDRRAGVIIRFNLDAIQRADFKQRQEGLKIQREAGVISANDWRERENMNPISDEDGGDDYIRPMNMSVAGEEPEPPADPPADPPDDDDDPPEDEE